MDNLITQVAEEHNLKVKEELAPAGTGKIGEKEKATGKAIKPQEELDDIQKRLDALKQ